MENSLFPFLERSSNLISRRGRRGLFPFHLERGLADGKGVARVQNGAGDALSVVNHAVGGPEIDQGHGAVADQVYGGMLPRNMRVRDENVAKLIAADEVHAGLQGKPPSVDEEMGHGMETRPPGQWLAVGRKKYNMPQVKNALRVRRG